MVENTPFADVSCRRGVSFVIPIRRTKKSVHDKNTCQGRIQFRGATLVQEKLPALDGIPTYSRQLTYALRRKILGYCLSLRPLRPI